ncbi:MAG TPA: hypothetical protein VFF39_17585, partial [Verrucomicrobiae bacterium]|nr:hypothetical protein [Verrucomicrobiae bacterium]
MITYRNLLFVLALIVVTPLSVLQAQNSIVVSAHTTIESGQQALSECMTEMNGLETRGNYHNVPTTCRVFESGTELPPVVSCNSDTDHSVYKANCNSLFSTKADKTYVTKGVHNIEIAFSQFCDADGGAYIDALGYVVTTPADFLESFTISKPATFLNLCLHPPFTGSFHTFPLALTHSNAVSLINITPAETTLGPTQQVVLKSNNNAIWTVDPSVGAIVPPSGTPGTAVTYTAPAPIDSPQDITIQACDVNDPATCAKAKVTLVPLVVTVNPSSAAVLPAKPLQLKATVTGPPNVDQTVTWSFAPGSPQVGTIDKTSGVYSTPLQVTTPATVIIKAASNLDTTGMSFGTATLSIGPVSITVSGPTDFLATPGAKQPYTASVISPGNTDVIWTAIA